MSVEKFRSRLLYYYPYYHVSVLAVIAAFLLIIAAFIMVVLVGVVV